MSELDRVYKQLFKDQEVNLASHEIKLALADDIKFQVNSSRRFAADVAKKKLIILKSVAAINDAYKNIAINTGWGKKMEATASKLKTNLDKLSKELGISIQGSEPDKLISEFYDIISSGQGDIDEIVAAIKSIGK
jgi:hypothetical protein